MITTPFLLFSSIFLEFVVQSTAQKNSYSSGSIAGCPNQCSCAWQRSYNSQSGDFDELEVLCNRYAARHDADLTTSPNMIRLRSNGKPIRLTIEQMDSEKFTSVSIGDQKVKSLKLMHNSKLKAVERNVFSGPIIDNLESLIIMGNPVLIDIPLETIGRLKRLKILKLELKNCDATTHTSTNYSETFFKMNNDSIKDEGDADLITDGVSIDSDEPIYGDLDTEDNQNTTMITADIDLSRKYRKSKKIDIDRRIENQYQNRRNKSGPWTLRAKPPARKTNQQASDPQFEQIRQLIMSSSDPLDRSNNTSNGDKQKIRPARNAAAHRLARLNTTGFTSKKSMANSTDTTLISTDQVISTNSRDNSTSGLFRANTSLLGLDRLSKRDLKNDQIHIGQSKNHRSQGQHRSHFYQRVHKSRSDDELIDEQIPNRNNESDVPFTSPADQYNGNANITDQSIDQSCKKIDIPFLSALNQLEVLLLQGSRLQPALSEFSILRSVIDLSLIDMELNDQNFKEKNIFSRLTQLHTLSLANNNFTFIPVSIQNVSRLQSLSMENNRLIIDNQNPDLSSLPLPPSMESLDLRGNDYKTFPCALVLDGNLRLFFPNWRHLKLDAIPESICLTCPSRLTQYKEMCKDIGNAVNHSHVTTWKGTPTTKPNKFSTVTISTAPETSSSGSVAQRKTRPTKKGSIIETTVAAIDTETTTAKLTTMKTTISTEMTVSKSEATTTIQGKEKAQNVGVGNTPSSKDYIYEE